MSTARIKWISGPVLRARAEGPFKLREAIRVGPQRLLGEVIRINEDEIVAQVYEATTGVTPGVEIAGTGELLGDGLGPAMPGDIFDGLMRPLADAATSYVEPGMSAARSTVFSFTPRVKPGDRLAGPWLMEDSTSTISVPPAWSAELDEHHNLILRRG